MMNQVQKDYMLATALVQAIKEELDSREAAFLKEKGYTVPHIWMLDDQDSLDSLNREFESRISDTWQDYLNAEKTKKQAEDAMIEFALSIFPFPKKREALRNAARTNKKVRDQLIDLTYRLDTGTIPA